MEVDYHFVKDRAPWRSVDEIIGVLLRDTQIIMLEEFPREFLPLFARPVNDVAQMRFNSGPPSGVCEFD